jgi:signal transduction histidine kinase
MGLHLLWWIGAGMSVVVSLFSHALGVNVYSEPCIEDACQSFLQLNAEQLNQLSALGLSGELYGGFTVVLLAIQNLSSWLVGFLVYRYGWRDPLSVMASLLLVVTGTIFSTDDSLFGDHPLLLDMFYLLNGFGSMYLFFLFLFPNGRFFPRWTAVPAVLWVTIMAVSLWLPALSLLNTGSWDPVLKNAYMLLMHGLVFVAQGYRYRHGATAEQKRQIIWFCIGFGGYSLAGFFSLLEVFVSHGLLRMVTITLLYIGLLVLPFSVGITILETRLRPMSVAFNRTLVYIVLSSVSLLAYVMLAGAFGLLLQGKVNTVVTLLATGFIAVLFHPLRERIQKEVNHLVFGERVDPYRMLSELTQRLEGAFTQSSLLQAVVSQAAQALRLPYAAIELQSGERVERLAAYGSQPEHECTIIPLELQGEAAGRLVLGAERLEESLPPGKRQVLGDLVRQVSIAVQAVRLTRELHRSRERLITTREEERRRLRRDLHDGLGSGLAGILLRLDEAVQLYEAEPGRAKQSLDAAQQQLRMSIADIRRLVYALRPPALDEFGLAFALQELAMQYQSGGLQVRVEVGDRKLSLPAAVEVAVYRIVQEALTNVVRHADATVCSVRLSVDSHTVCLYISDDGKGLSAQPTRSGVGIHSMNERAEELGGTCRIRTAPGEGTEIQVTLPWEEAS